MTSQLRLRLLRLTCLSVFLALSKLMLDPAAGQHPFAPFSFSQVIPLSGWQLVESQALGDRRSNSPRYDQVITGQRYYYQQKNSQNNQKNRQLIITVRYVVHTEGNVLQLIKDQEAIMPSTAPIQVTTSMGVYSRLTVNDQTHVTSCINPRGGNTVTPEQFLHNRYTYDGQIDRLLSWSIGRNDLLDKRCLWVDLTLSAQGQTSDQIAADLEQLWRDRVIAWQSQFPQP